MSLETFFSNLAVTAKADLQDAEQAVGADVKIVINDVEVVLTAAEADALAFLKGAASYIVQNGGQLLTAAATDAVQAAEASGGSAEQKLLAAVTAAGTALAADVPSLASGAVNLGIEAAHANLVTQTAQAAAPEASVDPAPAPAVADPATDAASTAPAADPQPASDTASAS